jgi:hypothetical protein
MRILKLFFISLGIFFLLLTGVGLLFPSSVQVSRAIDLPGQRKSTLINLMSQSAFQVCTLDTLERWGQPVQITDSSIVWRQGETTLSWILHGADGKITLQAHVKAEWGWVPWQRFRSLLMEPRYGPWMELQLGRFKKCLDRTQLVSVFR